VALCHRLSDGFTLGSVELDAPEMALLQQFATPPGKDRSSSGSAPAPHGISL